MTHLDVVARVVLPLDGDLDVLPLYVDGRHVQEPPADEDTPVVSLPSDQHPDQVLGRRSYRLPEGVGASFGTYLNAFPASYWRRWTGAREVVLRVRATGTGVLMVYRSSARGASARVTSRPLDGATDHEVRLPLDVFADGGWYWFDLVAGADGLVLDEADWSVPVEDPAALRPAGTTVGITTFDRPASCAALLAQLGAAEELVDVLDEVVVVDQGSRTVSDDPGFPEARRLLGDRLRVIRQANLGGSGGFSRAMLETLDADRSAHVLLLDDDVVCEPEGIARAVAFARHCRRPTVVGGHMFSMHERSVLHAVAEVVRPWQFRWGPAAPSVHDHDLARRTLRATPWLHRRLHADYTGWWMCLVPTSVLRDVGLSLPFFIKWDDAEFGLRASASGHPTVSLPGAAVWHVPWTDKDDSTDWQAYFHARNRIVAALLHSRYDRGGRLVRESLLISVKHVLAMQYGAAALRTRALRDVLRGPEVMHAELGSTLGEVRALRGGFADARVRPDAEDFAPVTPRRRRRRDPDATQPSSRVATLLAGAAGLVHQVSPVARGAHYAPELEVAAADAGWWSLARMDSALVATADGAGLAWLRRSRGDAARAVVEALDVHRELLTAWPELASRYRGALPELAGEQAWRRTLGMDRR
ncbi:glycosyltransferase [Phycicoccus sonneratiae]|uniref:Glycosyltransferase n=1 Tax=Phycicoccus sonneratiae TaxID=2807628 RepID=A0ABS2CG49_9MICO|nr:glycosyltransferase [Phycicoccus sonneraticus]MBM6398851.1 glycosyltransferase [Phycicoccus sonneraticus]